MGTTATPSDIRRGRRKVLEEISKDLDPASRSTLLEIVENWRDNESEEALRRLLGRRVSKRLLDDLKSQG